MFLLPNFHLGKLLVDSMWQCSTGAHNPDDNDADIALHGAKPGLQRIQHHLGEKKDPPIQLNHSN